MEILSGIYNTRKINTLLTTPHTVLAWLMAGTRAGTFDGSIGGSRPIGYAFGFTIYRSLDMNSSDLQPHYFLPQWVKASGEVATCDTATIGETGLFSRVVSIVVV